MPADLFVATLLRILVEVAGLALLGQGALALLAGERRHDNPFYGILRMVTGPVVRTVRAITPRFIVDAHVPFAALLLLLWAWIALALARRQLCGFHGLAC